MRRSFALARLAYMRSIDENAPITRIGSGGEQRFAVQPRLAVTRVTSTATAGSCLEQILCSIIPGEAGRTRKISRLAMIKITAVEIRWKRSQSEQRADGIPKRGLNCGRGGYRGGDR